MRLGVISDVHANIHALKAVWTALERRRVDVVVCAGDLVGYGATPGEVIDFLQQRKVASALGSADARIAFDLGGSIEPRRGVADETLEWTRGVLDSSQVAALRNLPVSLRLKLGEHRARVFHGSPHDPDSNLDLDAPLDELMKLLAALRAKLVIAGGSHIPYVRVTPAGIFLNPGSVGLSLAGEPGADCALLEVSEVGFRHEFLKVTYDVKAAAFDVLAWGLPSVIGEVLQTGTLPAHGIPG